jgi:hypothetical protein
VIAGRDGRDWDVSGISLGRERAVEARAAGCAQDALERNLRLELRVREPLGAEVGSAIMSPKERSRPTATAAWSGP